MQGEDYMNVKVCKYCECYCPRKELSHKMTLKMIMLLDRHLMLRGKTCAWLQRSDLKQIDPSLLYLEHRVCNMCYRLYKEAEKLMEVELLLAQRVGLPSTETTRYALMSGIRHS